MHTDSRSHTESVQAVRRQTAGLKAQRGEGGGVGEGGGQPSEAADIYFLCELRVTRDVQHTESGESGHHPS